MTSRNSYLDTDLIDSNQSCRELYVPKKDKFDTWTISPTWEISKVETTFTDKKISFFAKILELVAYVADDNRKEIRFWSQLKNKDDQTFKLNEDVTGLKSCPPYLAAVLKTSIVIYKITKLAIHDRYVVQQEHTITGMPYLPPTIVSMSIGQDTGPLMTCTTVDGGENRIKIYDVEGKKTFKTFNPHMSDLICATLNVDANKVATASIKGTVIRVFDVHGNKLHEFRRGLALSALIRDLVFSPKSDFLISSSNTSTIHVYKFPEVARNWMTTLYNSATSAALSTTSMVTGGVLDPLLMGRSHTVVRLADNWINYKLHGFALNDNDQLAILLSRNAKFFRIYMFDVKTNVDCYNEKEFEMY